MTRASLSKKSPSKSPLSKVKEPMSKNKDAVQKNLFNYFKKDAGASSSVDVAKKTPKDVDKLGLFGLLKDVGWKNLLMNEFQKEYMKKLDSDIEGLYKQKTIFPPHDLIFNAFNLTPLKSLKVVILGQDPYHDNGQAHGLCFSVPRNISCPPSLKNIYKELSTDIDNFTDPGHGFLESWAKQGVLMLNAILTVEAHKAGSHAKLGWERFTDSVLSNLSSSRSNLVFLLWGKFAEKKAKLLNNQKHLVLIGAHPSPLANGRFFGCRHFSKANEYLSKNGKEPVDWHLK